MLFLDQLQPEEKIAFFELAHLLASADGVLAVKEELILEEYRHELQINDDYAIRNLSIEEILQAFQSERSKNVALTELFRLIFSDGIYQDEERKSVQLIKTHFGFDPHQFQSFKDWVFKIKELSEGQYLQNKQTL